MRGDDRATATHDQELDFVALVSHEGGEIHVDFDVLENAMIWISENVPPNEIYDDVLLEEWAEKHGFVRGSKDED